MGLPLPPKRDAQLVQIVDAALAEAARKSGSWLVCKPGCTQCCVGVFAINQLDAARLRHGMRRLEQTSPEQAAAVRARARAAVKRLSRRYPGDPKSGVLYEDERSQERFERLGNNEVCPALDPKSGLCELYEYRPMTCRVFGPPVRSGEEGALGVCELCYHGATQAQIAACEMVPDPDDLEGKILRSLEQKNGVQGNTIVAYCLAPADQEPRPM